MGPSVAAWQCSLQWLLFRPHVPCPITANDACVCVCAHVCASFSYLMPDISDARVDQGITMSFLRIVRIHSLWERKMWVDGARCYQINSCPRPLLSATSCPVAVRRQKNKKRMKLYTEQMDKLFYHFSSFCTKHIQDIISSLLSAQLSFKLSGGDVLRIQLKSL